MAMTGWPSVTVVVPTRGHPTRLRRALASILGQDYAGYLACVVVFDRAEPFDLSDMLPSAQGRTLVVMRNTRTPGRAGARNTGVDASFGDLIAFCDDNAEWLPGKLSAQVEAMRADPDAHAVLAGIEVWRHGVRTPKVPAGITLTNQDLCRSGSMDLHSSTFLVEREAYEGAVGPFDEGCPQGYRDGYEWLLRASAQAPVVVVRDPLVRVYPEESHDVAERPHTVIAGIQYLLDAHPALRGCRQTLSLMEGEAASAHAALGHWREARRWAVRSIRHRPSDTGRYLALAVSPRLARRQGPT